MREIREKEIYMAEKDSRSRQRMLSQPASLGYGPSMLLLHHLLCLLFCFFFFLKKKGSAFMVRGQNSYPVVQQRG